MTVQEEVRQRIERDVLLAKLRKKIDSGKADFNDTFLYSDRAGKLLGEIFAQRLPDIPIAEREALCVDLLHDRYTDINSLCDAVQRALDKANGLHLKPQRAPFEEARAHLIGHSTADQTVSVETQQRRGRSATATMTRSMHDDRMKAEAKFRSGAGLQCYITRKTDGKCCEWCSAIAGRYEYYSEPKDVYRRHDNCGCSVTYENGRKRQDVWSKRIWEAPEPGAGAGDPVVFTTEQAKELQEKNGTVALTPEQVAKLQAKKDLTILSENGKINQKIHFYNIHEQSDNGLFTTEEIEAAMQTSPIGKNASNYFTDAGLSLEMNYDINAPAGIYGFIIGRNITVYAVNHADALEVSQTLVHEIAHHQFGWNKTQEDEINCMIYDYLHTHETISNSMIKEIVKGVKEEYSGLPEGNLYGFGLEETEKR